MSSPPFPLSGARPSGGAQTTIQALLPASACVEMSGDVCESRLFAVEASSVVNAVAERRREFATVRHCARKALARIGVPGAPIVPDADGAPRWPAGVVGSLTHCEGYRAAAVAPSGGVRGLGIDAEPHDAIDAETLDLIARPDERAQLRALADAQPATHWDRILFCAKEAVYKAWFPLTRRWLDFDDVWVRLRADGTFLARVQVDEPRANGVDLSSFSGRWTVGGGLVLAATVFSGPRVEP